MTLGRSDWDLDPELAYLNGGGFGIPPRALQERLAAVRREIDANPAGWFRDAWGEVHARAVGALAQLTGAPADTVALLPNASTGLLLAFRTLRLGPGDVVLSTDHAHEAVAANLAGTGVEHRVVDTSGCVDDDEFVAAVLDRADGVSVAVLAAVSAHSGEVLPVERVVSGLAAVGVPTVVDAAHVPGHLPIDLGSGAPDIWIGNLHKWACGPRPLGVVHVTPALHDRVPPLVPSVGPTAPFPDNAAWPGTFDGALAVVVPDVVDQALGFLTADERNRALADDGVAVVAAAIGAPTPERGARGWMRTVPVEGRGSGREAAAALRAGLARRGVEVRVSAWRGGVLVRTSTHVFTTLADHERLAGALRDELGS